jgi:hypothetical protein
MTKRNGQKGASNLSFLSSFANFIECLRGLMWGVGERLHGRILAASVGFVLSIWRRVCVNALFCAVSFFIFLNELFFLPPQYFDHFLLYLML